jgi:hypothetical protein
VFKVVAQEGSEKSAAEASGSLLDELVRDGARQMLAAALQAEVAAYIEQFGALGFSQAIVGKGVTRLT